MDYPGMGQRAAQNFSLEHTRQLDVERVINAAGNALLRIDHR
jgi:hypothetical protein